MNSKQPAPTGNEYHDKANAFLARFDIKCRITLSNTKDANWHPSGNHYRVTLSTKNRRLTFDFWGLQNDKAKGEHPHAYDILSCVGSDAHCPDTLEDFLSEFGYNSDSIKERRANASLFRRCLSFSRRIKAFFTEKELEALSEIS